MRDDAMSIERELVRDILGEKKKKRRRRIREVEIKL